MDAQSESCEPPPCDPQPPGKIRKAFKLFGKRKPGTSVASIFSMRGKGDGEPKSPPSRSKTMDGFNEPTAPEAEAEQVDLDQEEESQQEDAPMEEFTSGNANLETTPTRQSISSITSAKSLSFLNMIRKGRRGIAGERQAQTESQRPGRQRKGLKGLFGSVRWRGKEKEGEDEEVPPGPPLLASRSNSVEIIKESLTLTPGPTPRSMEGPEEKQQLTSPQEGPTSSEDSVKVSEATKPPTNERLSTLLGDISSILSLDSLGGCGDIVADVEAEWVKASSRVQEATGNDLDKTSAAILARSKLSPSPISTLSPTTSTKPSPTSATKPTPSPTSTKPIPSSLAKPVLSPTSTPVTKASPSVPSAPFTPTPTSSPLAKPTPATSAMPITQPTITPIPTPITQATPTSTSVSISESALGPTSSPTAKPTTGLSPKSSPEIRPATIPLSIPTSASITKPIPSSTPTPLSVVTPISETSPPDSVSSTPEPPAVTRTEPPPTPTPTPVTKPTHAPTPVTKPTPGMTHETKHATSATKYSPYPPPFGKPTPAPAPTPRPKLVTTFGLSTSRNTAPITKIETKQPTGQTTKSSVSTFQTDKTGTTSTVRKASVSEPTAPVAKPPSAVSSPPYVSTVTKPQPAASPMAVSASKPVFEASYDISNTVTPASSNSLQSSSFCTPTSAPILTSSAATTKTPMVTSTPHSPVLRSPSCPPQSSTSSKRTEDGDFSMDVRDNLARQEGIDTRDSLATQSGLAKSVKKSPAVKPTTLSKIPVSGGGRTAKQHHRDAQPNGDDDHSNLPTPVHEDESPVSLSRESSSKDPLSDFSTESGAVTPTLSHSQEDILDGKLGLQTGPRPATGAASLSRESKIPIKHGSTATYHSVQGRAEAARSKIPVSKVPVRRTSNKPATTSTAAVTRK